MTASFESATSRATRRSIRKVFSSGNVLEAGSNYLISLHSVDDELLASMLAFFSETMIVERDLTSKTKEAVATLANTRGKCQICMKTHPHLEMTTRKAGSRRLRRTSEKDSCASQLQSSTVHIKALEYAGLLIHEIGCKRGQSNNVPSTPAMLVRRCLEGKKFSGLKESTKMEISLVVVLSMHMHRVVSALKEDERISFVMKKPRTVASFVEVESIKKTVGRMISPGLSKKVEVGRKDDSTMQLFPRQENKSSAGDIKLPVGLTALRLAGDGRARPVSQLYKWVARYESDLLLQGDWLDYDLIRFIDSITTSTHADALRDSHEETLKWAEDTIRKKVVDEDALNKKDEALVSVLMLTILAPCAIYHSKPWKTLVSQVGISVARSLVVYWSLRTALQEASISFAFSVE